MADTAVQTGTIRTRIPARLDRLPWSRFHWRILIGLGTVWILDGLEVTMVGSVAGRITEPDSGLNLTSGDIGLAGAIYVVGACLGALVFGQLTDRLGRKKLFMVTLAVYILATAATGASMSALWFFAARFVTGAGIGGEYAAINSAIDELIPARVRGRVDLLINGTYWLGSAGGSALAIVFLNRSIFPADIGWRLAFAVGIVLGLTILLIRRHVPESPRWLFIHGREDEAEAIVRRIEADVTEETGTELDRPEESLTVRQRRSIPFREIARVAFSMYPRRALLGLALFVGQAFIYNGITFNLGTLFTTFYDVSSSFVPVFVIIYAVGNLLGPLTLGRLFDTVGRKRMISGTYLGSAAATIPLALVFVFGIGGPWLLIGLVVITFFLASAGASAAYLTVSEIFPMETRALAIAFFYAVGTAVGGIAGPLLFGELINSGVRSLVMTAFFIGAAVMALGGVTELFFGVAAERQSLESIAMPLTADDAREDGEQDGDGGRDDGAQHDGQAPRRGSDAWLAAQQCREDAALARARAADHRAEAYELEAGDGDADDPRRVALTLARVEELRADEFEQLAMAHDAHAAAEDGAPGSSHQAEAARQRAAMFSERAAALTAETPDEAEKHAHRADAAEERARASEQRALAELSTAGGPPEGSGDGDARQRAGGHAVDARAALHRTWADLHEQRAAAHDARAAADDVALRRHTDAAAELERRGLAAEARVRAAEQLDTADDLREELEEEQERRTEAAESRRREAQAREADDRIRRRIERRQQNERRGLRQFRPGPSTTIGSPWLGGAPRPLAGERALDTEVDVIARALDEHGPVERRELAQLVGARYWGPGRFGSALDTAVEEQRIRRMTRHTYGPGGSQETDGTSDGDPPR